MVKRAYSLICMLFGTLCLLFACTTTAPTPTSSPMPQTTTATKTATAPPVITSTPTDLTKGIRIAYACGGDLCLYDGDIQETLSFPTEVYVTGYNLSFSPDGSKLLYESHYPPGDAESEYILHVLDLGTQHSTPLLNQTQLGENSIWWRAGWTPDGKIVALNTIDADDSVGFEGSQRDDLWTVDVATGELTQVLQPGEGGDFVFSPDGSHVIVSTPENLSMLNSDGSDRRTLVEFHPTIARASSSEYRPMASWAADSSYAWVAIPWADEDYGETDQVTLWQLPLSGPATRGVSIPRTNGKVSWSPEHTYIVYGQEDRTQDAAARYAAIIADADGTDPRVYTTTAGGFQSWSPDSQHFVYTVYADEHYEIYLGSVEQSPKLLLSSWQFVTNLIDVRWIDPERMLCRFYGRSDLSVDILHIDGSRTGIEIREDSSSRELDLFVMNGH